MKPYTFHISLYDAAFFGMLFIGLTFVLLLWFGKKVNQPENRFLALALGIAVLWMARLLAIDIQLESYLPHWSRLPMQFSLGFGPLIYFYVIQITQPDYKFTRWDLIHFSPLLLELGIHVIATFESIKTGIPTYHTPIFQQLNPALQLLAFISVAIYIYRCHMLIGTFYRQLKFNDGDRHRQGMQWLHKLIMSFGLFWLLWVPFVAIDYFYYQYQLHVQAYYPLYLLLFSMLIWTAARTFLRTELAGEANAIPVLKPLLPAELRQKATWMKRMVKENRYYEDPELSLGALAGSLTCTRTNYRVLSIPYSKKALMILLTNTGYRQQPVKCRIRLMIISPC